MNCKKIESLLSKTDSPRCELQVGDVKVKQVYKIKYQGSINDGDYYRLSKRHWKSEIYFPETEYATKWSQNKFRNEQNGDEFLRSVYPPP